MKNEVNNDPIYLDMDGYNQYLKEIEKLENAFRLNAQQRSDAFVGAVGDGWHDNFAFEEANREEYRILCELNNLKAKLSRIVIIKKSETEENSVANINDYVLVDITFEGEETEEMLFKLVGLSNPNVFAEIKEISINSPLGKTVYQKPIGYIGGYSVRDNKAVVVVKNISKNLEDIQGNERKLTRG